MKKIGLYIHIPFCDKKCRYCDFYSVVANDSVKSLYIEGVLSHLRKKKTYMDSYVVDTIYVGGGTPSLLSPDLMEKLFEEIWKFEIADGCEITMEVNPGTIDIEKVKKMKELGVNRISIGSQSFCNDELKFLGRIHNAKDIKTAFKMFRKSGFNNISLDILFAFPTQTIDSFIKTLNEVIKLDPEHISAYPLKIEENTEFGQMMKNGVIDRFNEDIDREMYHYMIRLLEAKNYKQYEISSFSKPGAESKHNLRYWDLSEYIGIGAGAHSFVNSERYRNSDDIYGYITDPDAKFDTVKYSKKELMDEYMMLGFRRTSGISKTDFKDRFDVDPEIEYIDVISKLIEKKLIKNLYGHIVPTSKGIDFANQIFLEFV